LKSAADGVYATALASLLQLDTGRNARVDASEIDAPTPRRIHDLKPRPPHFPARARAVIHIVTEGGPSQVDLFDPKETLNKNHGKSVFHQIADAVTAPRTAGALMRSPFRFAQHGESGIWLSELLPHLARVVDDIAVIRSMHTPSPAHPAAESKMHTGRVFPGSPALGSWVVYGLGSESQNLPAYVALDDFGAAPMIAQYYHSGWMPPIYQATRFRSEGSPVLNLRPAVTKPAEAARVEADLLAKLDRLHRAEHPGQLQLEARIASYELAARMQLTASEALDLNAESPATHALYGIGGAETDSCARRLLIARRLVERGVRFVQIFTGGWDNHNNLVRDLRKACLATDQPVAALLEDLKRRGLLDSTLVLWGGEFGRLPIAQLPESNAASTNAVGRDHGPRGFSVWMAGGGTKGGFTYGSTDEIGFAAGENPVSIADWHATTLHLLGLNARDLTYLRDGLPERLTGNSEVQVIQSILA
jgi:hypothetical protein